MNGAFITTDIYDYAKYIIPLMGGNEFDIKQITEEIKEAGYKTEKEVNSHLINYYIDDVEKLQKHFSDYIRGKRTKNGTF